MRVGRGPRAFEMARGRIAQRGASGVTWGRVCPRAHRAGHRRRALAAVACRPPRRTPSHTAGRVCRSPRCTP
eukprot:6196853-Prymnesium_polylepis.1